MKSNVLYLVLFCALLCFAAAGAEDVAALYKSARTALEDERCVDVSGVPEMLEQCAAAGYEPAKLLLLDVYEGRRKGLEPQPRRAYELAVELAAAQPRADAPEEAKRRRAQMLYRLALYLERGYGCTPQPQAAYEKMQAAAQLGLRVAQAEFARYLMNGVGHEPVPRAALHNLRILASQAPQTPHIYFYLGHIYLNGLGLRRPNAAAAKFCFELGAAHNDPLAINNLAAMYELGVGVKRDPACALRLYRRAADLGCREASVNMQRLAYRTDAGRRLNAPWGLRVRRAALRVVRVLPLDAAVRQWFESPLREETP